MVHGLESFHMSSLLGGRECSWNYVHNDALVAGKPGRAVICDSENDMHCARAGGHDPAGLDLEPGFGLVETNDVMHHTRTGVRKHARARLRVAEPLEGKRIAVGIGRARCAEVYTLPRLGGDHGWLYANWLWWLRGVADRLVDGPGFRRGRGDPESVRVGDALDFWRAEAVGPGRLMRLRAEMKVPGEAWLQFEAKPLEDGKTLLVQTAYLTPKGLFGFLYWYGLYPFHGPIFGNLIRAISERAGERHAGQLVSVLQAGAELEDNEKTRARTGKIDTGLGHV